MPPDERSALRGFVARLIGFAPERAQAVGHALRAIELAATCQAALVLCGGDGDLVPVARGVHRHALGDERLFVLCDTRRRTMDAGAQFASRPTGADALAAAIGGTVCVRAKRLPLPEVEKGAWRMLALREAGNIAGAAALLGMGHTSLGEWLHRRRTEHTRRDREKPERARPGPARRDPLAETRRILREARALRRSAS